MIDVLQEKSLITRDSLTLQRKSSRGFNQGCSFPGRASYVRTASMQNRAKPGEGISSFKKAKEVENLLPFLLQSYGDILVYCLHVA